MQYRKYIYGIIFLFFIFCFQVKGQNKADFQIVQTESTTSDTLYLDFKIKRNATSSLFLLGGHNIVFRIDTAVIDTSVYKVVNQGIFGSSTSYQPIRVQHVSASVYQLILLKRLPFAGSGILLLDSYMNAGRVAFLKKKCGVSAITYPRGPFTTITDWLGGSVEENGVAVPSISVTKKVFPKALLTLSKKAVCANSTIDIKAEQKAGATNFALFSKSKTGVIASLAPSQNTGIFNSITVIDTTSYFVTFKIGTCSDTTEFQQVVSAPASPPLVISSSNSIPCLGDKVTFTASPLSSKNNYVWQLSPSNTNAAIVGGSSGIGKNSIVVDFKGTSAYNVTISVQDTNEVGCVGKIVSTIANPSICNFNADFEVNGSSVGVNSCKNSKVIFKDASKASGILSIVKWDWYFGIGSNPSTFSTTDPNAVVPEVTYSNSGVIGVKLVITSNAGLKDSVTKAPTISILSGFTESPKPACGSSSCNEVNFNWQTLQGATDYKVRYKKGNKGVFTNFISVGVANTYKVNASSAGMGGSLNFTDTQNDTVFFQVKAIAGACDSVASDTVFCRPSYCSTTDPKCVLPPVTITVPNASCKGSVVQLVANFTPKNFSLAYPTVRLSWNNEALDTSSTYNVGIVNDISQDVKLLIIDTAKTNCYSLNTVSVPVTPFLDVKPDLGIQSLECDKVTFVWKHVPNAVKYQIKYSGVCIPSQDWVDAPLNGLAEFYEINGLPNNCQLNFKVRAIGGCNTTQSDTLISPPTCTCYIGHIASGNMKTCALDTTKVNLSNIQINNWLISWKTPGASGFGTPSLDTTFSFVPNGPAGTVYKIEYILSKADGSCSTNGYINDTIDTKGVNPTWDPTQTQFCISDAISLLSKSTSIFPNKTAYSFLGEGVRKVDSRYFFDPKLAGLGVHNVTFNSCGSAVTKPLKVVNIPCVSTIVDAGFLKRPEGLYTACDGTIFITDAQDMSIYKYQSTMIDGVPELVVKSKGANSSVIDVDGNFSVARFGEPYGIVLNENTNNDLYFADFSKGKVKRIELDKQKLSTYIGLTKADFPTVTSPISPILNGRFSGPRGMAINEKADTIYVSDVENNNIKAFTFKGVGDIIKLVAGGGGASMPTLGKNVSLTQPFALGADSQGISIATRDNNLLRYVFKTDIISEIVAPTAPSYADGAPGIYRTRTPNGITQRIGDWVYFSDQLNYSLRRFNVNSGFVETVAGSPPALGRKFGIENGAPFDSRFSSPGALAFNIKGYIDILDGGVANTVRRYYLPDWSLSGFWKGFDTTYVVKCDHDTITPDYSTGILRLISGKDTKAVTQGKYFAPKDTGNYLLGYYTKIGRCDTTFFKNVYVRSQPIPTLLGDTVCATSYNLVATAKGDTTLRYKWFGPDKKTIISGPDTSRTLSVTKTGRYYVEIYFGKAKQCSILDSADVFIVPPRKGVIQPIAPFGNAQVTADSVILCQGNSVTLSFLDDKFPLPSLKYFKWSTGDTTRNISAIGSAKYSVTGLDSLGCEVKASYKVVQLELPNICIKATDASGVNLGWGQYQVSTFAGKAGIAGSTDGVSTGASFKSPWGLAIYNDTLYVTDKNHLVRAVSIKDAKVSTFLGKAGDIAVSDNVNGTSARFNSPTGIRIDKNGVFYIVNNGNHTIYRYDRKKNKYLNFAGSGTNGLFDTTGSFAEFDSPKDIEVDPAGHVFVSDFNNHNIRVIDQFRNVTTYAGSQILNTPQGTLDGKSTKALFNWPWGLALSTSGNLYVSEDGNHAIRKINLDTNVRLVAGTIGLPGSNGSNYGQVVPGLNASFEKPWNLTVDPSGNVFFADAANRIIRRLDKNGNVTTIAGSLKITGTKNGKGDTATFSGSTGMAFYPKTGEIFVADQDAHIIRKLTRNKVVYVCKGTEYTIGDTCTVPNVDVSWQKRTSAGLSTVNISQPFKDTATYILTLTPKLNGVPCGKSSVDSVVVKWNLKDKAKLSILTPNSPFYPCKSDTVNISGTHGYKNYLWFKRVNKTFTAVDTTLNNVSSIPLVLNVPKEDSAFYGFAIKNPLTGCYDTSINELKVKIFPRIDTAFVDTFRCEGLNTHFVPLKVDSTKFNYSWNFGETIAATSTKAITNHVFSKFGQYQVSMFGQYKNLPKGFSCIDTVTKTVKITARPKLDLTINGLSDTAKFCSASPVQADLLAKVQIDVNTAGSPYEFIWQEAKPKGGKLDSITKLDNTIAKPILRLNETTSLFGYKVFVKDVNGCTSFPDSVYARLTKVPPVFTVSKRDTTICKGGSVRLNIALKTGRPPFTFVWTNSAEVNVTDPFNPIFTPDPNSVNPRKYIVTLTDSANCGIAKDSVLISQYDLTVNVTSDVLGGLCRTISSPTPKANLTVTTVNIPALASSIFDYNWKNLTTATSLNVNTATLPNVSTAGNYEVEVVNKSTGCVKRDSILVTILNKPEGPILGTGLPNVTCSARTIALNAKILPPTKSKSDSVQYSWKVGVNKAISSGNDSTLIYNLLQADTASVPFKVFVQNRCGIDSSLVTKVFIKSSPKPNSDLKDTVLCALNVKLTASIVKDTNLKYAWYGPDNINTLILEDTNRFISVSKSGKYWVRVYDKKAPSCFSLDSSSVTLKVPDKGIVREVGVANSESVEVCNGATAKLEMKELTTTQPRFVSYKWSTLETTPTIVANGTKMYTAIAVDAIGCVIVDSFKVIEQPLPISCIKLETLDGLVVPIANKIALICPGSSYRISDPCNPTFGQADDSLIVKWQKNGADGIIRNEFPKGKTFSDTANYIVTVTPKLKNGKICINSSKDNVTIKWRPKQTINLDPLGSPVCSGGDVDLVATTGFQKYIWYSKPANVPVLTYLDTTVSNTFVASAKGSDPVNASSVFFGVIGYDQFGCDASAERSKGIIPVPKLDFDFTSSCLGQPTRFTPVSFDSSAFVYTWDFGDLNTSTDVSVKTIDSYTYTKSGTYTVKMSGDFKIPFNCIDTVEKKITIALTGTIGLQVNGGIDTVKFCGPAGVLDLKANVIPSPNNPNVVFKYIWSEVPSLLGGGLDVNSTTESSTALPVKRVNESSSLFGYSVRAIDGNNCYTEYDTVFARVSDVPKFGISVLPKASNCRGTELTFAAVDTLAATSIGNIYSYEWDTAGVKLNSDFTKNLILSKPLQTVDYHLKVKNIVTSCATSAKVPVNVFGPKITNVKVETLASCVKLDSVRLDANVAYATLPYSTIQWTDSATALPPTSLYNPKSLNAKSWPDTLHVYRLVVSDASGCYDTTYARVESGKVYPPLFSIVSSKDTGICVNGSVQVILKVDRSRGAYSFDWKDESGNKITVDETNNLKPIITVNKTGKYYVTMKDYNTNECGSATPKDSMNLTSYDMALSISGTDPKMCRTIANPNPSAVLQADVVDRPSVISPVYEYVWTNLTTGNVLNTSSPILTNVSDTGVYQVEVTNTITTCKRKTSKEVRILNSPEKAKLAFLEISPCNNKPIKLNTSFATAKAFSDSIVYEWFVDDSSFAVTSDSVVVYQPIKSDTTVLKFKVVAKNRCSLSADSVESPKLISGARAKLDVSSNEVFLNKEIVFTNNSTNSDSLNVLKLGDGSVQNFGTGNGVTLTYIYPAEGDYKVKLFANNTSGCNSLDSVMVKVTDKLNVFLPNVFSPSASEEQNRFFRLYGINISSQDFSLVIYNRWGQLVYSTSDLYEAMNKGWDGGDAQMGVYTFILKGMFGNGKPISKTGTVSLIR